MAQEKTAPAASAANLPAANPPAATAPATPAAGATPTAKPPATTAPAGSAPGTTPAGQAAAAKPAREPPPIIIAPGPNGIVIASEDVDALNEFERLLMSLANGSGANGAPDWAIFYLTHAKASSVAETLESIFAGGDWCCVAHTTVATAKTYRADQERQPGDNRSGNVANASPGFMATLLALGGSSGSTSDHYPHGPHQDHSPTRV